MERRKSIDYEITTKEWTGPTDQKDGDYVFGIIYRSQRNKEFAVIFSFLGIYTS